MNDITESNLNKTLGRIRFLKMLLSVNAGKVNSKIRTHKKGSRRNIKLEVELDVDEHNYQLCLDLALQNICKNWVDDKGRR